MASEITKLDFLTIKVYQAKIGGWKARAGSWDAAVVRNLAFCTYSGPYQAQV